MRFPKITIPDGLGMAWIPVARGELKAPWPSTSNISFQVAAYWPDESIRIVHAWANWKDGHPVPTPRDGVFPSTGWVRGAVFVDTTSGALASDIAQARRVHEDAFRRVDLHVRNVGGFAEARTLVASFRGHTTVFVDHELVWTKKMAGRNVTKVSFAGNVQWECDGKERSWQERPQWNGTLPLGAPFTLDDVKRLTKDIPDIEFQENTRESYAAADLCGTCIRDRWRVTPIRGTAIYDPWPRTGRCDDDYIEATEALGPVSVGQRDGMDRAIVAEATGFHARAIPGRFTGGNPPERVFIKDGRVDAHRPGQGSYYEWGNTLWREFARQGDAELLRCARLLTNHTIQMGQVAAVDPSLDKWHQYLGAFWKRGEPVGNPPGTNESDAWSARLGRAPDPFHLFFAWVFDGDLTALARFNLWLDNVGFKEFEGGRNREGGKTIGVVADVCEWLGPGQGTRWVEYLHQLVNIQMGTPGFKQSPNSLWDPLWVNKALPHLNPVTAAQLKEWATEWRDDIAAAGLTMNPNETEAMGLSVIVGSEDNMDAHESAIAHYMKRAELVGPGALGDNFIAAQWGAYRWAASTWDTPAPADFARKFDRVIPIANLSFQDYGNISRKGTRLIVRARAGTLNCVLYIRPVSGDFDPVSWVVTTASGTILAKGDMRTGSVALDVPVPEPGVYHVCLGGHEGELLWNLAMERVELPVGIYYIRAPNQFHLAQEFPVLIFPESKLSRMKLIRSDGEEEVIDATGAACSGLVDLVGGQDPVARMITMQQMELL